MGSDVGIFPNDIMRGDHHFFVFDNAGPEGSLSLGDSFFRGEDRESHKVLVRDFFHP